MNCCLRYPIVKTREPVAFFMAEYVQWGFWSMGLFAIPTNTLEGTKAESMGVT